MKKSSILKNVDQSTDSSRLIYGLITMTAVIIIVMMGYSYYTSIRMNTVYTPLVDATMEIKLNATTAHLWFEEIVSGDSNESMDDVWKLLDKADWYAEAMLKGGQNDEGTFVPLDDPQMQSSIRNVRDKLTEFREITQQRLDNETSGIGSDIDQRYDALFEDFVSEADDVETLLQQIMRQDMQTYQYTQVFIALVIILAFVASGFLFYRFNSSQKEAEAEIQTVLERAVNGLQVLSAGDYRVEFEPEDENDQLGLALQNITDNLREITAENENQIWRSTGQAELNNSIQGQQNTTVLAGNIIRFLCEYLEAQVGVIYLLNDDVLELADSYAYLYRESLTNSFKIGEGLVGQVAREKKPIVLCDMPSDHLKIISGLRELMPTNVVASPFMYEGEMIGVVELGMMSQFSERQMSFLEGSMQNIAIAFNTVLSSTRMQVLLEQTQRQSEELQTQQEELRVANEELVSQTETLQESETKLKEQQAELETTNVQLEHQASALEESHNALQEKQVAVDKQNQELKVAQTELERKAEELTLTSKYKSEFLANMSHELRTPLNSLLILSRMLTDNKEGNLTAEQVESAQIIFNGGNDLLALINEVLDLSKVEAGKMDFHLEPVSLADLIHSVESQFKHVAEEKGLDLNLNLDSSLPETVQTDQKRVEQIVKNLLSNAFKFTEQGSVSLSIEPPVPDVDLSRTDLNPAETIAIKVTDTGIGMTPEQQKIIFEAFQQADGSTSRLYGGTGLGLSISREIATKLGGQITLQSMLGQGSTFILYLPIVGRIEEVRMEDGGKEEREVRKEDREVRRDIPPPSSPLHPLSSDDDRHDLQEGEAPLLIIEDDANFARILYNTARKKGLKSLLAGTGKTALQLAHQYQPTAIILDLKLPDMSGWEILAVLKDNPNTRHIPVHIMSVEDETMDAYKRGAIGYLTKPVNQEGLEGAFKRIEQFTTKEIRRLLLVEDDTTLRHSIKKLLSGEDVEITEVGLGQVAFDLLKSQPFDCMILDLKLPDITGFELLNLIETDETITKCPIIVYTGRSLTKEENEILMKYTDSIILKGVKSPDRLLDETALFLHQVVADMPQEKQKTIKQLYDKDDLLYGKKILIVDDDMRNSFALSKLLGNKGVVVEMAANGEKALEVLENNPDIDLVLMDIMMPVMDGYEAIKRIRMKPEFRNLPVLALTAKAMKGDREKCLQVGANDYLSKPIDSDRLFSMLRVWLY
ncbi:response regulator [Anaerolineales bacterium HSG25]|nr:response regulator [Anaerolineales bacterium HSG25]